VKICVAGLWHLGTVTAACLAAGGHDVTGLDPDGDAIARLSMGSPPLFEPGLEDLVKGAMAAGRLRFTTDTSAAARDADVVWITYDTPVDDEDRADVESVVARAAALFPYLRDGAMMLISSQLPVGSTCRLEDMFARAAGARRVSFAYSPENLRLGKAIDVFMHPDRIIAGVRSPADRRTLVALLAPFTDRIEWMSVESAEMTKHALNGFLATSVAFINEIAAICEQVGADAAEVERGLKTESRIGPKAYLSPGGAFAGGTLARDVMFLSELGHDRGVPTHLLASVKTSNDAHRQWALRRVSDVLGGVNGRRVAVWGLTYKPGTDTLRRSSAIELCRALHDGGAHVRAHDPAVRQLPPELASTIHLASDPLAAADRADALVVATPWPDYRGIDAGEVAGRMSGDLVLDANRFLGATLGQHAGLRYLSVGKATA
jgi:UDPglucose 6-dehydrogenase